MSHVTSYLIRWYITWYILNIIHDIAYDIMVRVWYHSKTVISHCDVTLRSLWYHTSWYVISYCVINFAIYDIIVWLSLWYHSFSKSTSYDIALYHIWLHKCVISHVISQQPKDPDAQTRCHSCHAPLPRKEKKVTGQVVQSSSISEPTCFSVIWVNAWPCAWIAGKETCWALQIRSRIRNSKYILSQSPDLQTYPS